MRLREASATDPQAASRYLRSQLSPQLKASLRRRRIRERKWAAQVLEAGVAITFFDKDHGTDYLMTLDRANEVLGKKIEKRD